jgi:hypothetical protein
MQALCMPARMTRAAGHPLLSATAPQDALLRHLPREIYLLGASRAHPASHGTCAPAQAAGEWGEPALLALHYAWTAGLAFACLAPAQAVAYLLLAQARAAGPARMRDRRPCCSRPAPASCARLVPGCLSVHGSR